MGGVNLRSVFSQDVDKMEILGSFLPLNYFTFFTGTTSCLVSNRS